MYLTGMKSCFFHVTNFDFCENKNVEIQNIKLSLEFIRKLIDDNLLNFQSHMCTHYYTNIVNNKTTLDL